MSVARFASISFCPRFFHEPPRCRLDLARWTFPEWLVAETCWPEVRVAAAAVLAGSSKTPAAANAISINRENLWAKTKPHLSAECAQKQRGVEHHFTFGCSTPLRCSPR